MLWVYTFIHYGNGAAYDQERGSSFLCAAAGGRCPEKREVGVTTQELAEQLQMQRSNLSTLLNELVADGRWKSCRVVRCTTGR